MGKNASAQTHYLSLSGTSKEVPLESNEFEPPVLIKWSGVLVSSYVTLF
jgi:hypothetical protein